MTAEQGECLLGEEAIEGLPCLVDDFRGDPERGSDQTFKRCERLIALEVSGSRAPQYDT